MRPLPLVGRKHPALRDKARHVTDIDESIVRLSRRMVDTCRTARGLAVAAPQVGQRLRLFVTADGQSLINPTLEVDGGVVLDLEGCLSLPGRVYEVPRYRRCAVFYTDLDGNPQVDEADGLQARMLQHELDHLDGVLISGVYPEVTTQPS